MSYATATRITPVLVPATGVEQVLASVDTTNGNVVGFNPGRMYLRFTNTGVSTATVTVNLGVSTTEHNVPLVNPPWTVPLTSGDVYVADIPAEVFQPGTQDIYMTFTNGASLKIGAFVVL